jgi:hypothetical protein
MGKYRGCNVTGTMSPAAVRRTDLPDYATVRADAVPPDVDAHRKFLDVDVAATVPSGQRM